MISAYLSPSLPHSGQIIVLDHTRAIFKSYWYRATMIKHGTYSSRVQFGGWYIKIVFFFLFFSSTLSVPIHDYSAPVWCQEGLSLPSLVFCWEKGIGTSSAHVPAMYVLDAQHVLRPPSDCINLHMIWCATVSRGPKKKRPPQEMAGYQQP